MDKELEVFFKKAKVSGVPYEVDLPVTDSVKLVWATPTLESHITYMARVSNPANQEIQDTVKNEKLISYLIKHQHWSPFEMVNICMEINTTRDIARQILRHRSFTFQEFSQRYAESSTFLWSEARMQDQKNRQASLETAGDDLKMKWYFAQEEALRGCLRAYKEALQAGIAKEVARKVLPEGLTMSKMYMNGSLRSWIHYVQLRTGMETQKEHRIVAQRCKDILIDICPTVMKSL
jgi:thymidylate synthase (FAD)